MVLSRIKSLFVQDGGLDKEQVVALTRLPPEMRLAQLGAVLHEICVKSAARFVEEEHHRADSPFRNLPKSDLFHEMLVINFWIFERLFQGKRSALTDHLYRHYSTSFVWGRESSRKELLEAMRGKFKAYDKAWDDYSGHQDAFAREAIGIIFGGEQITEEPQAAFWLISHADRTMNGFARVKTSVDQLLKETAAGA